MNHYEEATRSVWTVSMQPVYKQIMNPVAEAMKPLVESMSTSASRHLAETIDFSSIHKTVLDGYKIDVSFKLGTTTTEEFSLEEKEAFIEEAFTESPELAEKVEAELALTNLTDDQKLAFRWLAVLAFMFMLVGGGAAINSNEEASKTYSAISTGGGVAGAAYFVHNELKKRSKQDDESLEE